MQRGKLVTIEGTEGVGKTTQVRLLDEYCKKHNANVLFVREPGNTYTGERIREIILKKNALVAHKFNWIGGNLVQEADKEMSAICEAYLYAACRVELIEKTIIPALNSGVTVVCDRYIDSSVAYQGYGRGLGVDIVEKINFFAMNNCYPDYTIFLNMSPEESFKRKGGADMTDRLELAGADFHERVYYGFLAECEKHADRFLEIKPKGDKHDTHKKIVQTLIDILPDVFKETGK